MKFTIEQTTDEKVLTDCARMMNQTEPWITLQRDLNACENAMRGNDKEVYVVMEKGNLHGFIVLQMAGILKGYIQSICVAPGARNAGVGSALINFAEKRIFSESPNVFMFVSTFNEGAARLYLRLGYEKIGVIKNFVTEGLDELLLRKTIGSLKSFDQNRDR